MFEIDGQNIKLTRGDGASIGVTVYEADGETVRVLTANDKLIFRVKEHEGDRVALIEKTVSGNGTDTELDIQISGTDSGKLVPGEYLYNVAVQIQGWDKQTIIGKNGVKSPKLVIWGDV